MLLYGQLQKGLHVPPGTHLAAPANEYHGSRGRRLGSRFMWQY